MDQTIRDGGHKILGGTTSSLIGFILVVIYATTKMLSSEIFGTRNRHKSIESTAKHKSRRQGKQKYFNINMGSPQYKS